MSDRVYLPQLAGKLLELTGSCGPGYQYTHRLIASGRLPLAIYENGRYYFRGQDLPRVCALLGLQPKDPARRDPTPAIMRPRPPGAARGGRPPGRKSGPQPTAA